MPWGRKVLFEGKKERIGCLLNIGERIIVRGEKNGDGCVWGRVVRKVGVPVEVWFEWKYLGNWGKLAEGAKLLALEPFTDTQQHKYYLTCSSLPLCLFVGACVCSVKFVASFKKLIRSEEHLERLLGSLVLCFSGWVACSLVRLFGCSVVRLTHSNEIYYCWLH